MNASENPRVVLVTGGGSGAGQEIALAFARAGDRVFVTGRTLAKLEGTVALAAEAGITGTIEAVAADMADDAQARAAVERVVERAGRLDVAVNSAGVISAGTVADSSYGDFLRTVTTNTGAAFLSMKHEIAAMRGRGGAIINISSNIGPHATRAGFGAYGASKAAVSALTKAAALEAIEHGIRVNAISPGPLATDMSKRPGETDSERDARLKGVNPSGRAGRLEELAGTVLWLASDAAGYVVGADIVMDGGASA